MRMATSPQNRANTTNDKTTLVSNKSKSAATQYVVTGGTTLSGSVFVQGSKNAALPAIAAALLVREGQTVLRNVPLIDDVKRAVELAVSVGAEAKLYEREKIVVINASHMTGTLLAGDISRKFRGSVLFIPALLARLGRVEYEGIGGCNLGTRALDFHYRGFVRLGATVEQTKECILVRSEALRGADLYLDRPSHTGTENLIMGACLASGHTTIENAACEPEVLHMIELLCAMGAKITGAGTGRISIEGVDRLKPVEWTIMPDRIDAAILAMAAVITSGEVNLVGADFSHLVIVQRKLEQMGAKFATDGTVVRVTGPAELRPINVITDPYPGFATDLQSPMLVLATQAHGTSYIHERLYDGRFRLTEELGKLGASTRIDGEKATIYGPKKLNGSKVDAVDLRSGMSLILAGLVARGETVISGGEMIDRGHECIADRLSGLGARVVRVRRTASMTRTTASSTLRQNGAARGAQLQTPQPPSIV